jgi:hypothetical protein
MAEALVNPSLQPNDLFERHKAVLVLAMTGVDEDKQTVELRVVRVCKGEFAPENVTLSVTDDEIMWAFYELAKPGRTVVAFVGSRMGRPGSDKAEKVLFYAGGRGRWQIGRTKPGKPGHWQWTQDLNPTDMEDMVGMIGTYNGSSERFAEMMVDKAHGRYFFPARPFSQFKPDRVIGTFEQPIRGVALYDIDGDGNLDLYACCAGGDRAYLQTAPLVFTDATEALGMAGVKSPSVNVADVNADGLADLLAGGVVYLGSGGNGATTFRASGLLPQEANSGLKCAAFVEINGDGYPDIVVSRTGGGLHAYLNPGENGGVFSDATAAMGLDAEACGAGLTGFFAPGDWNGDGRTDLFYAAGKGLLLVQGPDGRFAPVEHDLELDFKEGADAPGLTGAGCFASLWRADSSDVVFPTNNVLNWIGNVNAEPRNLIPYGNEISVGIAGMLATIAEDLNADGRVDTYSTNTQVFKNMYHTNRGYGSFMTPLNYKGDIFPGPAHERGAWGVAAGDVNGDGANDLLLGGADGRLVLVLNDCLRNRGGKEHPTAQERVLARTRIVTVRVLGKVGVLGAVVTLADAEGNIVGRRVIGSNVATGCRGPDTVNLAVREPGAYAVRLRYSDGLERTWPVPMSGGGSRRVLVRADRDGPTPAAVTEKPGRAMPDADAATSDSTFPRWGYAAAAGAIGVLVVAVVVLKGRGRARPAAQNGHREGSRRRRQ